MFLVSGRDLKLAAEFMKGVVGAADFMDLKVENGNVIMSVSSFRDGSCGQFSIPCEEVGRSEFSGVTISGNLACDLFSKVGSEEGIKLAPISKGRGMGELVDTLIMFGPGYRFELPVADREMFLAPRVNEDDLFFLRTQEVEAILRNVKAVRNENKDERPTFWVRAEERSFIEVFAALAYRAIRMRVNHSVFSLENRLIGVPYSVIPVIERSCAAYRKFVDGMKKLKAKTTDEQTEIEPLVKFSMAGNLLSLAFSYGAGLQASIRVNTMSAGIKAPNIGLLMERSILKSLALMDVSGKDVKAAYSRLDSFAKRNPVAAHKVVFRLGSEGLLMSTSGGDVGSGHETIPVKVLENRAGLISFSASGEKLSDMLSVSKDAMVRLYAGGSNIVLEWTDKTGVECTAIVAGMSV